MKPKILLIGGWGWSATSPLVYTLQRNAKYAHFGYGKTFRYLGTSNNKHLKIYNQICDGTWENFQKGKSGTHHMNHTCDLEPLRDFSLDHLHKLMSGEPTVPKYMEFYHELHDHVISKGYKSLGDGCMGNRKGLTPEQEIEYSEALKSEFDVKVLLIARDPVRRAFSHFLYMLALHQRKGIIAPRQIKFPNYTDDLHTIRKYYDNVYVIVMEELWEGDGARELSQFLDHPITNLWKNLYAPDRSHLIEYDEDVPCQSQGQNLAVLTPEIYDYYRKKYDWMYRSWIREFGSLPLYWGKPL